MMTNQASFSSPDISSAWSVVAPPNEIDLTVKEQLETLICNEWAPGSHLAIDLSSVSFMDSTALHWLLQTRDRAIQSNREMRLIVAGDGRVEWLLEVAGIKELFSIHRKLDGMAS
jgi:anti-anti-sigma factor